MQNKILNILADRDGTIIHDCNYLSDPDHIMLYSCSGQGLKNLIDTGCRIFLVSNQSGVGRGYFSLEDYYRVQDRLRILLSNYGVFFQEEVFCPHGPDEGCCCRKPAPGLWKYLADSLGLKAEQSIMIGDKISDIIFAKRAGLSFSILVLTGQGQKESTALGLPVLKDRWQELDCSNQEEVPHILARDLGAACEWILKHNADIE